LKNESPDLTSILTSNKDPEGIQKGSIEVEHHAEKVIKCLTNDLVALKLQS